MIDAQAAMVGAKAEASAEVLGGLIAAYHFAPDGTPEELSVEKPIEQWPDGWLWLHFNLADARACYVLRSYPCLPAAARDLLVAPDEHQQMNANQDCLYGILPDLVRDFDAVTDEIGFLHFALTDNAQRPPPWP